MKGFSMESVWLRTPAKEADVRVVHVNHEDTYKRLLADGWTVVPLPEPDVDATPASESEEAADVAEDSASAPATPAPSLPVRKPDEQSAVRRARHGR
jgi:hypothetical protein